MENISVEKINLKLDHITDKVIMGPQAEILELVNRFNEMYDCDIRVTRTFRWSPGIYDKIKELLTRRFLGWNKRTNSMYSLFNKIANNEWYKRRLRENIMRIDQKLSDKRDNKLVFQENKEEIKEYFNVFLNKLIEFDNYNHERISLTVSVDDEEFELFNQGQASDMNIKIDVLICPEHLTVEVWDDEKNEGRHITNLYTPYSIRLCFHFSFVKWFNQLCTSIQSNRDIMSLNNLTYNSRRFGQGWVEYEYPVEKILFPYISRHLSSDNVCLGNLQEEINRYLVNLNPIMFYDMLYRWATVFVVHKSHPYNPIATAFCGQPKDINNDDLVILCGSNNPDDCRYQGHFLSRYEDTHDDKREELIEQNYCDRSECQLREVCTFYINTIHGDKKPLKRHNLEPNQRSAAWPSWMVQDESGTWIDTRSNTTETVEETARRVTREHEDRNEYAATTPTVDTPDMQVESDMASNDGGEIEDRDGERTTQYLMENDPEVIQESPSTDESDNYEVPF